MAAAASEATGAKAPIVCGIRANSHVAAAPRAHADEQSEADLACDQQKKIADSVLVRPFDPRDQAQRERDRHRVIAARLGLERPRDATADVRESQGREHRGGVGRSDDRPQQDRLKPGEVEQGAGDSTGHERTHDHPDGAEQRGRYRNLPQPSPRSLQASLVQDQPESDDSDLTGQLGVIELDPSGTIRAQQHSEAKERDEHRQPGARCPQRDHDARRQNRTHKQEDEPFSHAPIFAPAKPRKGYSDISTR
jgi:hypothetical protein